jgi:hypothetical protein
LPEGLLGTRKAERNSFRLVLNGDRGQFSLNGTVVGKLDVSANMSAGDEFADFRIAELPK